MGCDAKPGEGYHEIMAEKNKKQPKKSKKPCHKFECGPTAMYEQYCVNCGFEDKEHMSVEEWGQTEYDEGKKAGIEEGKALLIQEVKKMAAEAFADERDVEAELYRDLVKVLKKK